MQRNHNKYIKKDKKFYLLKNLTDKTFLSTYKYGGMLVSHPQRKFYKKLSNSKQRRIMRDWLQEENWDKKISSFRFEKSILWEMI